MELIVGIAQRTGLPLEALAVRAAIKPETMRKVAKGYQKTSDQLLAALKNVETAVLCGSAVNDNAKGKGSGATVETQIVPLERFRRCGAEGMIIRLESLNPAYKPQEYSMQEFRFIYPAVDLCRKLLS